MIKQALEYIVGMRKPEVMEINGQNYTDKPVTRVIHNPLATPLRVKTLTSLIDYVNAYIDTMAEKMVVQVHDPLTVSLYSQLDRERTRECLMEVNGEVPSFPYNSFIQHENFLIALQAKFLDNEDRRLLLKFAGTVEAGTIASYGDDGVTQKATIKKGISSVETCLVPNPIRLRPYRTFVEVEQPESSFVFRMKEDNKEVLCAIYEADGGAWKNDAMKHVKAYLLQNLNNNRFTVIS